jgi:probable F420-dependent oxidoreductase
MRVGLFLPSVSPIATPEFLTAYAETAEDAGFDRIWIGEHVVVFDEYESKYPYSDDGKLALGGESGMLELFTTLTYLAATTSTIRVGSAVCLLPQRNPVYTAKEAATVDWLSKGRLDLGLGIGWTWEEFGAVAASFPRRGARMRDYVDVLRACWRDDPSTFHGEFYDLEPCRVFPKPVQDGGPPVYFGGESDAALRRVAQMGDGWHGFNHTPETTKASLARLEPMLADAGRSLADIDITVASYLQPVTPADLPGYADAGAQELVLTGFAFDTDGARETLKQLGDEFVGAAHSL